MFSIGKCTAGMAQNYYSEERGYYDTEGNEVNTWQGKLCQNLG